jgi:signal transduction histidine kinase
MMTAPRPSSEPARLDALRRYEILDTDPDAAFDDLAVLAALVCRTPIALVTLIDDDRQWFKSRLGIEVTGTARDHAFCAHAILEPGRVLEIPDATADIRFAGNPFVTGEPQVRFYAGAPLVTPDGHALGTVCVIDRQPRRLTDEQTAVLLQLSRHAVTLLEVGRRARESERAASEAKREFLRLISHELRTPMNGILGMTNLLLESGLSAPQRELAAISLESGEALLTTFNRLLEYAEIVAGRVDLQPAEFHVPDLVMDVQRQLLPAARKKGLALSMRWSAELPELVYGDARLVHRVLSHLAGNAIKFTARGEVTIEIGRAGELPGGVSVRFAVSDTGIGVRPETTAAIFQPFVQGDRSDARSFDGTGVGLTICRRLVDVMGGDIGVRSEPGAGATFWFEVPVAFVRAPENGAAPVPDGLRRHDGTHAGQRRFAALPVEAWGTPASPFAA